MKKKLIYAIMLSTALFMGCSEEFLEGENTNVLTASGIAEYSAIYPELLDGSLNGITSFIIEPYGVSTRHYDFGQKGVDIWTDMVCGDMALSASAYGWYNNTANMVVTTDFTNDVNDIIWQYYYRIISVANSVIASSGGNDAAPETDEGKRILGQAKVYRAYAYFYLVQLFQTAYDPTEEVLPFYNGDVYSLAKVQASVIYDQIVSDLTHSITLLDGYTRDAKNLVDQTIAQGFLAYTYAAMGNYTDAKTMADAVIGAGYTLNTAEELAYPGAGSGFNDLSTSSWIWGYDLTEDLGHQLIDWWGQIDPFTYSYAWAGDYKSIDDLLYSQIPATDVRSSQFGSATGNLQPINKFFDPGRTIGGQYVITTDLILMRVEEFYLLSAESAAMSGNEAAAKATMIELLTNRMGSADATTYISALSGQDLIDEIYLQTRIELWGEGKSYLAMKRNQATVTRGTNHVYRAGESFSYDSDEMSFQIPESEINNNPSITGQN
ncbi:RagB/SusD family nutrient uptake outer membrane protein [Winogradskyella endarachnes]|uniref:RagB/SusD family nutrient uptake outer membrane protein n=1 Tax=Winogradskyella endarachnes TaxID=2681965 RepID=A0A6L6UDK5_9FLAO|nr:RagB/SusD family nutrient uptake outer membrane protein [Winogradskyella endarachnes]MUU78927.1 RagB/SusD family nutrient uptake outer membrane protein [Winogradskyella endarachnes]